MTEVNRFEVIDHTQEGEGRDFVRWTDHPFKVELSFQDNGRTLKVFLLDKPNDRHLQEMPQYDRARAEADKLSNPAGTNQGRVL